MKSLNTNKALVGAVVVISLAMGVSADNSCQIPVPGSSCSSNDPATPHNTCIETVYSPSNPSETCQEINWEYWFSCGYTPCMTYNPSVKTTYVIYPPIYDYYGLIIGCGSPGSASGPIYYGDTCEQDYVPLATATSCGPCMGGF